MASSHHPPTLIVRHRRENLKKCSLRGLEGRSDLLFFTYPYTQLPDLSRYFLLCCDAPPLEPGEDGGMMLIDATWRLARVMERNLPLPMKRRSLPSIQTAYPRRQEQPNGLATVEALYAAYAILGRPTDGILDNYHWKEDFIQINHAWFDSLLSPAAAHI